MGGRGPKDRKTQCEETGLDRLAGAVISDLVRVGLVEIDDEGPRAIGPAAEGLELFLPLLERCEVRLVPVARADCPVRFCTGILKMTVPPSGDTAPIVLTIPAGGQGNLEINAALGCLGELAERVSLCSLGAGDPRVLLETDRQPQVDVAALLGLSDAQAVALGRSAGLESDSAGGGVPDWSALTDRRVTLKNLATGQVAQLPSFGAMLQEGRNLAGRPVALASTVGCAVWPTREGARERALLELAERDAVAQAWYNRLGITRLEQACLEEILPAPLIDYMDGQPRAWGVYALRTDLKVAVALAVSYEEGGYGCAFGSSAGWDLAHACSDALQELLQSENALTLMEKAYPPGGAGVSSAGPEPRQLVYARRRSILQDMPLASAPVVSDRTVRQSHSFGGLMQSCIDAGIDLWEFDATRPDLNIPCIKLMSSQLCNWEPRFGRQRLYRGVVDSGLRDRPASEAEFAARPFPF
jgi:ribosomal protein S12 methylthiotransferase accessory factor